MAAARLADAWSAARRTFSGARAQASRIGDSLRPERTNSEPHMTQAGSKSSNEPTMEDILASIRRIIAEDYSAQAAMQVQSSPQPAPAPAQPVRPVMPQATTDILDLNSRGERFLPPMPEVVQVPPPPPPAAPVQMTPVMPRAAMPNLQASASAPQPVAPGQSATQGFAARAVSEFSERLGRSFAAAERYQREIQVTPPVEAQVASAQPGPVAAREPISQSAVDAVAAAVQSHLAEAQAAQIGNTALKTERAPEPLRPVEPAKPAAEQVAKPAQPLAQTPQRPALAQPKLAEPRVTLSQPAAAQAAAPAPAPVVPAAPQPRVAEPIMQNDPPPAWLVSPKTGASISGSFKALQEKQAPPSVQLTDLQSAALQELVAAALRPMLKDWLDAHLPGMVERMITAEIQRVTRGE